VEKNASDKLETGNFFRKNRHIDVTKIQKLNKKQHEGRKRLYLKLSGIQLDRGLRFPIVFRGKISSVPMEVSASTQVSLACGNPLSNSLRKNK